MARHNRTKILQSEISLLPDRSRKWSVRAAAIFPNSYPTAMSNLGFLCLFETMHNFPEFYPQRFFVKEPYSLETGESLRSFPILAASLSYEPDYLNLVSMLRDADIPVNSDLRKDRILIVGGAAPMINPYPLAPIADAIFLGEGVSYIEQIFEILSQNPPGIVNKADLLQEIANVRGVWVPSIDNNPSDRVHSTDKIPPSSAIISSFAAFPNMVLVQIQRGCPFKCPFCATPIIYNPFLNYPLDSIRESLDKWNKKITRIGLVGSALADYNHLQELIDELSRRNIAISTSSLRLDRLNPSIIEALKISHQKTLTFAPEAGSSEIKRKIGKKINAAQIIDAASRMPSQEIKLYYIIGLPGETIPDIEAIADELCEIAQKKPNRRIIASVNAFIPKRGTLWCDAQMAEHGDLIKEFKVLKKLTVNEKRIRLDTNYNKRTRIQWALSTGGRDIGKTLIETESISSFVSKLRQMGWNV